jgi:hypothetical protein
MMNASDERWRLADLECMSLPTGLVISRMVQKDASSKSLPLSL